MLQSVLQDVLQAVFRQLHVVLQVGERDLWLDHPELGQVPGRVAVLRPERGPKGVHLAQGHGPQFCLQLAAHRQVGFLAEEVLADVHRAVFGARRILDVQRRDAEHLASPLGVTSRDDGGVELVEPALVEKAGHGVLPHMPHAEHRPERVGPEPQVRFLAQEIQAVPFHLDGELVRVRLAKKDQFLDHQLGGLPTPLAFNQGAQRLHGRAGVELLEEVVGGLVFVDHPLEVVQRGSVVHGQKAVVSKRPHPSAHLVRLARRRRVEQVGNGGPRKVVGVRHVVLKSVVHAACSLHPQSNNRQRSSAPPNRLKMAGQTSLSTLPSRRRTVRWAHAAMSSSWVTKMTVFPAF